MPRPRWQCHGTQKSPLDPACAGCPESSWTGARRGGGQGHGVGTLLWCLGKPKEVGGEGDAILQGDRVHSGWQRAWDSGGHRPLLVQLLVLLQGTVRVASMWRILEMVPGLCELEWEMGGVRTFKSRAKQKECSNLSCSPSPTYYTSSLI